MQHIITYYAPVVMISGDIKMRKNKVPAILSLFTKTETFKNNYPRQTM